MLLKAYLLFPVEHFKTPKVFQSKKAKSRQFHHAKNLSKHVEFHTVGTQIFYEKIYEVMTKKPTSRFLLKTIFFPYFSQKEL